jgi:HTH-type transcriptional regulator/antitoxin HigA
MAKGPFVSRIGSDHIWHPGKLLAEELEVRDMTQKQLAEAIGRPPQAISEIIRGKKAITAETALQLERAFGTPAYLWLRLQADYDLGMARLAEQEREHGRRRRSA